MMRLFKVLSVVAVISVVLLSSTYGAKSGDLLDIPEVSRDKVICFALYTVDNNIMKMTAQLYPLQGNEARTVRLETRKKGQWVQIARSSVIEDGWTAHFKVENWDSTSNIEYRLTHGRDAKYTGLIRKDPVNKETIVVAAFTGNSIYPGHGGDISRDDLVNNIKKINPDLLFFSGDQVYDHRRHYEYWLKFGRDFGDVIRNTPTVTIPDDHDVGQANLWGASGKKSNTGAGHDGGYFMPIEYVKQVERAQTSHLPDPYDPTPVQRGLGVYYTSLNIGRISFAIIEDRKFKSGPSGLVPKMGPRPDHINDPSYDPKTIDVPGAVLLGDRQLKFLRDWGTDWHEADIKAVLSQTIFCGGAHIHGKVGGRLHADMDSNGWPQTGRNKALEEIRRSYAVHIAGDQHLATIFHHGIDEWEDAGYSFCVPSIANLYLRWWDPVEPGMNSKPGMPEYTGRNLDGFGNRVTCWAAANPNKKPNGGDKLTTRAAGFGVVRFNKKNREITFECWPRNVDVKDNKSKQYTGWPKTISQTDNYARKAVAWLPTLKFKGVENPVVQIIDESNGEIVYTLRIKGNTFKPKVFREGKYTIKVGREKLDTQRNSVQTVKQGQAKAIDFNF
ncbi:MAG: alkaline phosphatase D family protein [Anaerohalosphaera sp.]|nr:alkaline phosphatase D family protein [Anaerohalosphaera sp.]